MLKVYTLTQMINAIANHPEESIHVDMGHAYGFRLFFYLNPTADGRAYNISHDIDSEGMEITGRERLACNTSIKIDGEHITAEPIARGHIAEAVTASAMNVLDLWCNKTRAAM